MIRSLGHWLLADVQETHSSAQPQLLGAQFLKEPRHQPLPYAMGSFLFQWSWQTRREGETERGLLPCITPQLGAAPSHWEGAGPGHASCWLNQCLDKTSSMGPAKPPLWAQQNLLCGSSSSRSTRLHGASALLPAAFLSSSPASPDLSGNSPGSQGMLQPLFQPL